ncbi:Crp/Fnr family transcriptional regulator [Microbulbifer sp. THAF38]|uniref:Crp/Fnr family transcriptional regulator n=1 Tax=Microbulbifer sp. THAF38 TaxID=2587856 RepID=UPI00126815B3|nr:Crp/Fnr family transcriptional regulator [Microbulbifer sp. THAF38]QFT56344.1 cAMP-activated global transcriptional regulator CRP [Microbulbifer sp. THAF38]
MNNKVSFIDKCPLLAGLPDEAREFLAQKAYCQHFSQGDTIYPSGSHLERLSIIAKGQVRICSSNFAGREATLAILDNGAWFGDTVFCPGTPRVFGARAHSDCVIVDISGELLREKMKQHPEAYPIALEQISRRLWTVMSIIQDDVLRGTEARIARRLFFMAQMHNGGHESSHSSFRLTKELLANTMGMTRQGVHRVLKNIESQGLIECSYGRISVPDLSRLGAYIEKLD